MNLVQEIETNLAKSQQSQISVLQEDQLQYLLELKSRFIRESETVKQKYGLTEILKKQKIEFRNKRKSFSASSEDLYRSQTSPFRGSPEKLIQPRSSSTDSHSKD